MIRNLGSENPGSSLQLWFLFGARRRCGPAKSKARCALRPVRKTGGGMVEKMNNKNIMRPGCIAAVCLAAGLFLLPPAASRAEPTRVLKAGDTMTGNLLVGASVQAYIQSVGPIRDVRAFGAVADGATSDNAAIAAAIASLGVSSGGVVYFPAGTYRLDSPITLNDRDNIIFRGEGRDTVLHAYGFNGCHFDITDSNGITIEDMQMKGEGIDAARSVGGVVFRRVNNDNTSHTVLRNLFITDITNTGIAMSVPILTTIENVKVRYTTGHGFFMYGGTSININTSYAITTVQAGFRFEDVTYSNINASVAEVNGVGFDFLNSKAITLNGCGTEAMLDRSVDYPGYAYRVNGRAITCIGCYARASAGGDINEVNGGRLDRINFVHWDAGITETVLAGEIQMSSNVIVGVDTLVVKEGRVGVNQSTPTSLLEVAGSSGYAGILTLSNKTTEVNAGAPLGRINMRSYDSSTGGSKVKAYIQGVAETTFTDEDHRAKLEFGTSTGTDAPSTRLTINGLGYVGIGNLVPATKLHVSSGAIYNDGTGAGITTTGTMTAVSTISITNAGGASSDPELRFERTGGGQFDWAIKANGGTSLDIYGGNDGAPNKYYGFGSASMVVNTKVQLGSSVRFVVQTKATIAETTPGEVGEMRTCSDCTAPYSVCVSTGTAAGAFALLNTTNACQ